MDLECNFLHHKSNVKNRCREYSESKRGSSLIHLHLQSFLFFFDIASDRVANFKSYTSFSTQFSKESEIVKHKAEAMEYAEARTDVHSRHE